ncbi:MAG: sulfurtransferase [Actinomycetota bacterium]|nr:sulfurtransferase [Actinomycetota bacterium]
MIAPVVDADFLEASLHAGRPVVLADVRWYLDGRDGHAAYAAAHLPGALWVDLHHDLAGHDLPATAGRHPLPTPAEFAAAMSALGIGDDTVVVAYDDTGGVTAGRLVVMLRMLGSDAALLNGGLTAWIADGGEIETGPGRTPTAVPFTAAPWPIRRLASADDTVAHAAAGGAVLDARAAERFTGAVTMIDPRPGHIPGARNAPCAAVLGTDGRFLPTAELLAHYERLGATTDPAPVAYCGSGVSACMNVLAMEHVGLTPPRLYVASFSGWSADAEREVHTGD